MLVESRANINQGSAKAWRLAAREWTSYASEVGTVSR